MIQNAPRQRNPKLFDKAITQMQDILENSIDWLEFAYGRVEHIKETIKNKTYSKPVIFTSINDYIDVLPDDKRGNSSFFIVHDNQNILNYEAHTKNVIQANFSLIFWFDISKIDNNDNRNTETIKQELLYVLTNLNISNGNIELSIIKEDIDNIFKEYYISDKATKYVMHPYKALRFEGKITVREEC